jgi:hypothetical protein
MSFYSVSSEHKNSGGGHNPLQNGVEHNDVLPNEVERTADVSTNIVLCIMTLPLTFGSTLALEYSSEFFLRKVPCRYTHTQVIGPIGFHFTEKKWISRAPGTHHVHVLSLFSI